MKIALSIDLDYFCRELPEWDWGHSEDMLMMNDIIWVARYHSMLDVLSETNVNKYADCMPDDLLYRLRGYGCNFSKRTKLGIGWSHKFAYNFFNSINFDALINVDAHHDLFDGAQLNCGNWVEKLRDIKAFQYTWVYPKWLPTHYVKRHKNIQHTIQLKSVKRVIQSDNMIVGIYIAQSPAWVPPYMDKYIDHIVKSSLYITGKLKFDVDDTIMMRKQYTTSEIQKMHQTTVEAIRSFSGK